MHTDKNGWQKQQNCWEHKMLLEKQSIKI